MKKYLIKYSMFIFLALLIAGISSWYLVSKKNIKEVPQSATLVMTPSDDIYEKDLRVFYL